MKQKTKIKPLTQANWRQIIFFIIIVLAAYVLIPQLGQFHNSITAIKNAQIELIVAAHGAILLAALSAALTYSQLVLKPIRFSKLALVQYTGMFINRLVPAGIGGISLFIRFLYKQHHTLARSSAVVAMNTAVGLCGHIVLVVLVLFMFGTNILPEHTLDMQKIATYATVIVVVTVCLFVIFYRNKPKPTSRISRFFHQLITTLLLYRTRKLAVSRALLCAMLNTLLHAVALALVVRAFSVSLPFEAVLIILSGGVLAATITPTPGGVLGAEAGITAVLVAYGIDSGVALAIALSYRLASYWLPIIPGIFAFLYIQKKRYI